MAEQTFSHRENFSIPMASQIFLAVRIYNVKEIANRESHFL